LKVLGSGVEGYVWSDTSSGNNPSVINISGIVQIAITFLQTYLCVSADLHAMYYKIFFPDCLYVNTYVLHARIWMCMCIVVCLLLVIILKLLFTVWLIISILLMVLLMYFNFRYKRLEVLSAFTNAVSIPHFIFCCSCYLVSLWIGCLMLSVVNLHFDVWIVKM
jgi:hypothetical protein